jgi:FMN phosphatase YigB (HAD superfamily)
MYKKLFVVCIVFSFFWTQLFFGQSNITVISSIRQAIDVFEAATPEDLFVFDVDETLIEPTDPTRQFRYRVSIADQLQRDEFKEISDDLIACFPSEKNFYDYCFHEHKSEPHYIFISAKIKGHQQPVEQEMIEAILGLQKRSIKIISLTAFWPGRWYDIPRIEAERYHQLCMIGLDFSKSFPIEEMVFSDLREEKRGLHPLFYKGVICATQGVPKGIVLAEFLNKMNFKPAHIYYFDDNETYCQSVATEIDKLGIPCQVFHYQAARKGQGSFELNLEVFKFECELMKQRGDFVSYLEAQEIFNAQLNVENAQFLRNGSLKA